MSQKKYSGRNRRLRLFADVQIQGGLCARVALYWVACQSVTLLSIFGLSCLREGGYQVVGGLLAPVFVFGVLFIPLALFDVVVFSNKFAGPMRNFRHELKKMAAGERVSPIQFRSGDFLGDIRDNYNKLQAQLDKNILPTNEDTLNTDFFSPENRTDENSKDVMQTHCKT